MGGAINVQSEAGRGSTFWIDVSLPVHPEELAPTPPPINGRNKRVLIVDDIEVNRRIAFEQLSEWGFSPDVVSGGPEALQALRVAMRVGRPYELAILDYFMPGMDGEMLAREIRKDPSIAATSIIVMSSVDQDGGSRTFRSIGVAGYLVKPVRSSLLLQTVAEALGKTDEAESEAAGAEESAALVDIAFEDDAKEASGRLRVLLAEDNEVNQLVIRHMLKENVLDLEIANNGHEAVRLYQEARGGFDIILMDISMPEMDGYAATLAIRDYETRSELPRAPIICLTAHVMSDDVDRSKQAGMDDFLSKPISQDRLDAIIRRWLYGEGREEEAVA